MKVFGTGWQRTGTSSLARALNSLDIPTKQYPWQLIDDLDDPVVHEYDGFTDNPIPILFRELDEKFPGSRFIHSIRPEESWIRSVHWLMTTGSQKFRWDKLPKAWEFADLLYGTRTFDEQVFLERYRRHNRAVLDYFEERPEDLLVINIHAGDGYERICPFLDKPVPNRPFPHANVKEPFWRVQLRRFKRRLRR